MKKIYAIASALLIAGSVNAQTLGDLGVNNWAAGEPTEWTENVQGTWYAGTYNFLVAQNEAASTFEETGSVSEGTSAARIATVAAVPGGFWETQAMSSIIPGYLTQEAAYTDRPTNLTFDYKAMPASMDSAGVQVVLLDAQGSLVGLGLGFYSSTVSTWTSADIEIFYLSQEDVASISITAWASYPGTQANPSTPVVGSEFYVDNFDLVVPTYAPNVTNVQATDIADNGNGSDLQVTFDVPTDESDIANYHVAAFSSGDEVIVGLLLTPLDFMMQAGKTVAPNGSNQTVVFDATSDYWADGSQGLSPSPIVNNVPMVVVVYVEGANGAADVYANSNEVTLTSATAGVDNEEVRIAAYPNPANAEFNVAVSNSNEVAEVRVFSLAGNVVSTTTVAGDVTSIDVSGFQSGIYIYSVIGTNGEVISTNKFSVAK